MSKRSLPERASREASAGTLDLGAEELGGPKDEASAVVVSEGVSDVQATQAGASTDVQGYVDFLRFLQDLAKAVYGGVPTYATGFMASLRNRKYRRVAAPDLVHMLKGFGLSDDEVLALLQELPKVTYVQCVDVAIPKALALRLMESARGRKLR